MKTEEQIKTEIKENIRNRRDGFETVQERVFSESRAEQRRQRFVLIPRPLRAAAALLIIGLGVWFALSLRDNDLPLCPHSAKVEPPKETSPYVADEESKIFNADLYDPRLLLRPSLLRQPPLSNGSVAYRFSEKIKRSYPMDINQAKEILGEQFSFVAKDASKVIHNLNLPQTAKVLDVGTGKGYFAILLALHGYTVVTGEPDSDQSVYAKKDWLENSKKVGVDHLIKFGAFEAQDMLFDNDTFDAVFFFGVLHHIEENARIDVLKESVRVSTSNAIICFFEPNQNGIELARGYEPTHPDAADPHIYTHGLDLSREIIKGDFFDAYIFRA